jgi:hypothetical protein
VASTIKVDTIQSTTSNVFFQNSAGTEYARFDATGNMLVGTGTNGSASKLLVAGGNFAVGTNGSTPEFQVAYDGTNAFLDARLASGALMLRTGGSVERMRIDSSGNTFIGVASAVWDERLGVRSVTGTGQVGLGIYSPSTTYASSLIRVQSENATGTAYNLFEGRGQGGGVKIVIDGNGLVDLRNGQIKFPASQNASADANTLDDYEEGTWNPQHSDATNVTQSGVCGYVKIGSFVYVNFDITVTKTTATLANFPFAGANLGGATNYPWYSGYNTAARTGSNAAGHMNNGSTSVNFYDGGNAYSLTVGMRVIGAMSYRT